MIGFPWISSRSLPLWLGGALLIGGLVGCGSGSAESRSKGIVPLNGLVASGTTALTADLASAPWQVEYHGVRRLDFPSETPAVSYRERVSADGDGRFGLQVIQVIQSSLSDDEFVAKQAQNVEFNYRYRGFRVLDPFLFDDNYSTQVLSQDQSVAGIHCARLLIQKREASQEANPSHFLVDMDRASGLVLAWQELDSNGVLLAKMEFESFGLGPDLDPIPMGTGRLTERELAVDELAGPDMPFELLHPTLLPANFRLFKAYEVIDESRSIWVRQVFTDGQGALIFMHKKPDVRLAGARGHSTLGVYEEGQWTVLMGEINGFSLLAVGKLNAHVIQDFVSSCF